MNENLESLVLEQLRALRVGQDRIEHQLSELTAQMNNLESAVLKMRADNLGNEEDLYRQLS